MGFCLAQDLLSHSLFTRLVLFSHLIAPYRMLHNVSSLPETLFSKGVLLQLLGDRGYVLIRDRIEVHEIEKIFS